jgi:ectoine hydroxylase-related dioxygenase (phytanoyl-CoA dioxygenase family)
MALHPTIDVADALERLNRDGYVVLEGLLTPDTVAEVREKVERILVQERDAAFADVDVDDVAGDDYERLSHIWDTSDEERALWIRRIEESRLHEFDTPWPVPEDEVCISFVHIPTFFDRGRSQRIFNLINKDTAFAALVEHPSVLEMMDAELGRDLVLLDVSVNHVGPHTDSGGWHVDSPISQMPSPLPDYTLSIQTVWMLDDFSEDNGATHVVRGSHRTLEQPPRGRLDVGDEVVLEGPAGSVAVWLSQTWHRHGANVTDSPRPGLIVQYGRAWVKPFVDLRTPMTAEQASQISPRLRYMMGCGANPPVRG